MGAMALRFEMTRTHETKRNEEIRAPSSSLGMRSTALAFRRPAQTLAGRLNFDSAGLFASE
jgi:hypothetical protein